MAQVTIKWTGNPPCGAGNVPFNGETYYLYLDQTYFTATVTTPITATFVAEGPGGVGYDRTYTFSFLDSAIPTGFAEIAACHIKSVGCVDSCCAELQRQINDIELGADLYPIAAAYIQGADPGEAFLRTTLNSGAFYETPLPPITVTAGVAADDAVGGTALVDLGDEIHFWSIGGLQITAAQGSGIVQIEPRNLTSDVASAGTATAGNGGTPYDDTRPAIHFASDGLWHWNPTTLAWLQITGGGGGSPASFITGMASDTDPNGPTTHDDGLGNTAVVNAFNPVGTNMVSVTTPEAIAELLTKQFPWSDTGAPLTLDDPVTSWSAATISHDGHVAVNGVGDAFHNFRAHGDASSNRARIDAYLGVNVTPSVAFGPEVLTIGPGATGPLTYSAIVRDRNDSSHIFAGGATADSGASGAFLANSGVTGGEVFYSVGRNAGVTTVNRSSIISVGGTPGAPGDGANGIFALVYNGEPVAGTPAFMYGLVSDEFAQVSIGSHPSQAWAAAFGADNKFARLRTNHTTGEMEVMDDAGNVTVISPHTSHVLDALGITDPLDRMMGAENSRNYDVGKGVAMWKADASRRVVYELGTGSYVVQQRTAGIWTDEGAARVDVRFIDKN